MSNKKSARRWMPQPPKAIKFDASEKAEILAMVKEEISNFPKMLRKVSRMELRANRIYFYELVEQFRMEMEGVVYIKPLIDDKYLEFPYARITIHDAKMKSCTADWQRHNNQWISLYEGTLQKCLENIENDNGWFG